MEIIITTVIIAFAAFIIYRKFKKTSKGECDCGTCSSHCPKYEEHTLKINKDSK